VQGQHPPATLRITRGGLAKLGPGLEPVQGIRAFRSRSAMVSRRLVSYDARKVGLSRSSSGLSHARARCALSRIA